MTLIKKNNREGTDAVSNLRKTRASGSGQDGVDVFPLLFLVSTTKHSGR